LGLILTTCISVVIEALATFVSEAATATHILGHEESIVVGRELQDGYHWNAQKKHSPF